MSISVVLTTAAVTVVLIFGGGPPPVSAKVVAVIDPNRGQLLKDALTWMTFRKDGRLMEDSELEPLFLAPLIRKYTTSKFYRTFVIAFEQGVLPRLTLKENETCDPSYTFTYKDPFNDSVTWHFQKKFTFDSYDKWSESENKFCDYRQGLICKPTTSTCQCPEDSLMQPIAPNNQVQRCLIQQDKVCSLIDIAHGNDPTHSALASNLYHLIFNLEKPLSCTNGTQCRFKETNKNTPFCYANNNGPWHPTPPVIDSNGAATYQSWDLELGDECAIGLYATPGSCKAKRNSEEPGVNPGFVCYDFGPPRSSTDPGLESKVGFCFFEYGVYGLSNKNLSWSMYGRPLFGTFVHPRSVPLRDTALRDFYQRYITEVVPHFDKTLPQYVETPNEHTRCSVSKTQAMENAWEYFSSLEDSPRAGEDYVEHATQPELEAKLQSVIDLTKNTDLKVCKVYWDFWKSGPEDDTPPGEYASMKCAEEEPADADGNDGRCQRHGVNTKPYAEKLLKFMELEYIVRTEQEREEVDYRKEMLWDNPEPSCLPSHNPFAPQTELEDEIAAICPNGSVCYEDYSEAHVMYDFSCNLKAHVVQHLICHDNSRVLDTCEIRHLDGKIDRALNKLDEYASLRRGDICNYRVEKAVRAKVYKEIAALNRYEVLSWIERGMLCDRKCLNLECSQKGICECIKGKCRFEPGNIWKPREPEPGISFEPVTKPACKNVVGGAWSLRGSKILMIMFLILTILLS